MKADLATFSQNFDDIKTATASATGVTTAAAGGITLDSAFNCMCANSCTSFLKSDFLLAKTSFAQQQKAEEKNVLLTPSQRLCPSLSDKVIHKLTFIGAESIQWQKKKKQILLYKSLGKTPQQLRFL